MNFLKGLAVVAILASALAAAYGYLHNIFLIFGSDFGHIGVTLLLRLVGVVLGPIGIIMGYVS